ncbi:unnamed protein product [Caenorhabditis bovis]|uniref:Uncharacterized protein n=1 Tax=Caenorhabditis bovis TaxID=2654633 RepID=A0A8S1F5A3_9PELO|nr:unnamed protein product [Caenorhabditis bovis]
MKFFTSLLGTDRDRMTRKRRSLEVSLHRIEEKEFLLEMELEETRRAKVKIAEELRSIVPVRLVSTISVSSADYSFGTNSTSEERYGSYPVGSSTPKKEKPGRSQEEPSNQQKPSEKYETKIETIRKEEEERVKWLKKQQEREKRLVKPLEKY